MFAARNAFLTPAILSTGLILVGANAASGASVTIPAHAVGNIIVLFVYRSNATLATKPSAAGTVPAYVDIDAVGGANLNSSRTAYFVATATNHTSGTWTNATGMIAVVLSGQAASPIGGHAESGSTSASGGVAPSVTMSNTSGSSVLLHFVGRRDNAWTAWSAAPAGYTRRATIGAGLEGVILNTKDVATSDGAMTNGTDADAAIGYRGATVEILAA